MFFAICACENNELEEKFMDNRKRFDPEKLEEFSSKVLQKLGIPENDANITAKMLVNSDLRGVESHGVAHLGPFYVTWIKQGKIKIKPELKLTSSSPTSAIMDGDAGLGFVAGYHGMIEAIERAKKTGAGFVSVKNSTHCGAAAYYAMMALEHDMIGISMTVGGRIMMAPGSSKRAGGLNPIAVAVPAGERHPFVLDMSTSVVAFGKIEIAKRQGKAIPEGWVVDESGNPVTDTSKINPTDHEWKGGLLPLGGLPETGSFKGFGLAVLVDILCTILSGASLNTNSNHFFGAIRVDGFRPVAEFKRQIDELIDSIENLPPLPLVKKIYASGGFENDIMKDRTKNGIPLDEKVIQSLRELSEELNVPYDIER
jgi:L-2-hydroxycarboxylate dehydrogenase (NAD+)